jgi:hypothetical protein
MWQPDLLKLYPYKIGAVQMLFLLDWQQEADITGGFKGQ